MTRLSTVIFPVAGLGTRMLPATKVTPKELLPVYDTPLLQFALEEALAAGARRLVFVSHPEKAAIEDYLRPVPNLESKLEAKGKHELLDAVRASRVPEGVDVVFVMQPEALGLGHAVLCAADHVLDGPVGVILPDDLILGRPALREMADAFEQQTMTSLVAAQMVASDRVSSYGIFDCDDGEFAPGTARPARAFVEKPAPGDAPSRLAAVGRYVLSPGIFDALRATEAGAGGEIQLTDAIAAMGGIHAFRFSGTRHDCGSKDGMVEATLAVQKGRRSHLSVAAE
ncbi:UTP--glucose-1-phosphate uridylyltransferase [Jannaschia rubra]|uniref:UTP--glucose-1-phosphate uridylyltransferase n=1 Tax=Jannaschia rubra TaxID=282197 RepID=A0A0M6XJX4_9RHOB|nr:sugar phosphate nucleotidyltransferase [Jannaschia rubra]CTQ31456.1 UTP--glucose-1-phosphate uridylyltransferase [Jannaschia rubra]SFF79128.1 UTP--glucose-1-phosphate uridylyltransferase [Jannaschia rubra]